MGKLNPDDWRMEHQGVLTILRTPEEATPDQFALAAVWAITHPETREPVRLLVDCTDTRPLPELWTAGEPIEDGAEALRTQFQFLGSLLPRVAAIALVSPYEENREVGIQAREGIQDLNLEIFSDPASAEVWLLSQGPSIGGRVSGTAMTPKEFRHKRRVLGLTQVELAEVMGVSQSAISNWENGARGIDERTAKLLGFVEKQIKGRP